MTVKQLKSILENVPDTHNGRDVEVTIFEPEAVRSERDYMAHVLDAIFQHPSSISNAEFEITMGKRFGY